MSKNMRVILDLSIFIIGFVLGLLTIIPGAKAANELRLKNDVIMYGAAALGDSSAANTCSLLDVKSTTKGFLPPRMTTTQEGNISGPIEGLQLHNSTTHFPEFYTGASYRKFALYSLNGLTGDTQTFVNDTNVTVTSSSTTHTLGWTGSLALNRGGTGTAAASANAAFNALSPMTTGGDLIYGGASGVGTRLANGSANQVLQSNGTTLAPTWTTNITGNAGNVSGTVAIANGGTGQTTKAAGFDALSPMSASGDIIYGGTAGTGTRLAKGSDTQILTLSGGLPTWATNAATGNFGAAIYSANFSNGSATVYWDMTSSSYTDFTAHGSPSLTVLLNSSMGTVTAAGSNLPGITISSAPFTGTIRIIATVGPGILTANNGCFRLVEAAGPTLIKASCFHQNASNTSVQPSLVGYYAVTATTSYTFKVQAKSTTGSVFMGSDAIDSDILDFSVEYVK